MPSGISPSTVTRPPPSLEALPGSSKGGGWENLAQAGAPKRPDEPNRGARSSPQDETRHGSRDPDLVVYDIKVQLQKGVREKVLICSNRFFTPLAFPLEGEKLRFVIDLRNTASARGIPRTIPVDGAFIQQIRTHHYSESKTFRIVLDLEPGRDYRVNQAFYEAENIYAVEIELDQGEDRGKAVNKGPAP